MINSDVCACGAEHNEHAHNHDDHDHEDGCGCGHDHSHNKEVSRLAIYLLIGSSLSFAIAMLPVPNIVKYILFGASALLAGYDLFLDGIKELFSLKLEENSLLLIAVVASFILGEFPEACVVTILFKLGSFLESNAISRSKKSMESLTKIRPDYAYIKNDVGEIIQIKAENVNIGDIVYLRAGDKVALDCEVIEGGSSIDSSALTGESIPVYVNIGDELMSGSINLSGLLTCRVTKTFANSTASQIIDLVYESSKKKGKAENFISRFARIYTPVVIILAVVIAVVPPLIGMGEYSDFIMRALIFLVASCPCSLVISIPLTFFSAIGASSKLGILVKGSMYIEKLAKVDSICLDKTGTITNGKLAVDEVVSLSSEYTKEEILTIAANIEANSTHPIAASIVSFAGDYSKHKLSQIREIAGLGLSVNIAEKSYLCGGKNLLKENGIAVENLPQASVYLCEGVTVIGYITIKEEISLDGLTIVEEMKKENVNRVVMLTGDNQKSAESVAKKCGISEFYAGLLPIDKVAHVEEMKKNSTVLFVGDGINDAPVLAAADISISMGLGSEIANVSSDIILASNRLSTLPKAIALARRSVGIVFFNIGLAFLVKAVVLILGATGYGTMWLAVFADIGVTLLSVLNSIRILGFYKKQ